MFDLSDRLIDLVFLLDMVAIFFLPKISKRKYFTKFGVIARDYLRF